jgi:hypothetical protein
MAIFALFPLAVLSCSGSSGHQSAAASPEIKGTYKLVSRQLPDGTILKPPQIMGLFTYTETHRNFNIVGQDATGKFFGSISATYTLTPTEYNQTQLFNVSNDPSDRTKVVYDLAEKKSSAPVKMESGRVEFKPEGEPTLVFEGTKLTATQRGQQDSFVDMWEKVP